MAKQKTVYVCQNCGQEYPKWSGQCANCGEWNSLVEEIKEKKPTTVGHVAAAPISFSQVELVKDAKQRVSTGVGELDRVLGGEKGESGMVPGAVILLGGEPGIGKSTLLTQVVLHLLTSPQSVKDQRPIVYVAGEESPSQIALRINRIIENRKQKEETRKQLEKLLFITTTQVEAISEAIFEAKPQLVVVDSIQTVTSSELTGMPGTVGQVRASADVLTQVAKSLSVPLFLVGHVTKEGQLAGPKVLEHIVDSVLELSGERTSDLRILRAIKNRFGATDEVGVLQLTEYGFTSVSNPSTLFLEHQKTPVPGSAIVCALEGTRPLVIEVQALVVKSPLAMPRRVGRGVELSRIQVISAVLQKYCRIPLDQYDIFINLAGGYVTKEPSIDLGIAMALVSSLQNKALVANTVFVGEVGLLGEIRTVNLFDRRVKEAERLGFSSIVSQKSHKSIAKVIQSLNLAK